MTLFARRRCWPTRQARRSSPSKTILWVKDDPVAGAHRRRRGRSCFAGQFWLHPSGGIWPARLTGSREGKPARAAAGWATLVADESVGRAALA